MVLSREEIRRFYDRFGSRQDLQRFYETPALEDDLIDHCPWEDARSVLEFGCGTGALAERLLAGHLPGNTRYVGVDISETMCQIARRRLEPFGSRAVFT